MNRLSLACRTQVINCLVEGNSIRSTERMTDTHRDTIMRLMVEVGDGCARLADEQMRDLTCRRIQCDEIWSFVRVKQTDQDRRPVDFRGDRRRNEGCSVLSSRQADPRERHRVHDRSFGATEQPRPDFIGRPAILR
jgi:hypothetical protein